MIKAKNMPKKAIDDPAVGVYYVNRFPSWYGNILPLYPNQKPANIQQPASRNDILKISGQFSEESCITLGLSLRILTEESGRYTTQGSELNKQNLFATIEKNRNVIELFFQEIFSCMNYFNEHKKKEEAEQREVDRLLHKTPDSNTRPPVKKQKMEVDVRETDKGPIPFGKDPFSYSEDAERVRELREEVLCGNGAMPASVRLVFREHPFLDMIAPQTLKDMLQSGVVDQEEYVTMYRRQNGLLPLSQTEIKQNLKELKEMQEFLAPPPKEGAAPKKPSTSGATAVAAPKPKKEKTGGEEKKKRE
jgi:hypothetical protein